MRCTKRGLVIVAVLAGLAFAGFVAGIFPTFTEHSRYRSPDGSQTAILYMQSNYIAGPALSGQSGYRAAYVELQDAQGSRLTPWHLRFTCQFQLGEFREVWSESTMTPMRFVTIDRRTGATQCTM